MHTGYYFGFFFASVANYFIGANFGWRWMFVFGGLPGAADRLHPVRGEGVDEMEEDVRRRQGARASEDARRVCASSSRRRYLRRTMVMSGLFLTSIIGLWAGSIYVPTATSQLAVRAGASAAEAARQASYGGMVLAIGTIIGCVAAPFLAERLGRRKSMAIYFVFMAVSIVLAFGYVFYLGDGALTLFYPCIFLLGLGGANFALYTLWLPELYPTDCRASAVAFISSVGRFVGVAMVFLVGSGIQIVRQPGHSGGDHRDRVRLRVDARADERGDERQIVAGLVNW